MPALTVSSYLFYIKTRSNTLNNVFFETCTGFGFSWSNVKTSNGKNIITAVGNPVPNNVTLTKAANTKQDRLIGRWLATFCQIDSLGDNSQPLSGDSLIVVPRQNCQNQKSLVEDQLIFYNITPVSFTGWDGNIMDTTSMSRVSLELSYSGCNILPQ